MTTPNEAFLAKKHPEKLTTAYLDARLAEGYCPLCNEEIDLEAGADDRHHHEVICDCGFHYCMTCQHLYD